MKIRLQCFRTTLASRELRCSRHPRCRNMRRSSGSASAWRLGGQWTHRSDGSGAPRRWRWHETPYLNDRSAVCPFACRRRGSRYFAHSSSLYEKKSGRSYLRYAHILFAGFTLGDCTTILFTGRKFRDERRLNNTPSCTPGDRLWDARPPWSTGMLSLPPPSR